MSGYPKGKELSVSVYVPLQQYPQQIVDKLQSTSAFNIFIRQVSLLIPKGNKSLLHNPTSVSKVEFNLVIQ